MPVRNLDLHGSVPDSCDVALLLIDVINDLEFEHADDLLVYARPMARRLADLANRARAHGIPVIFVNDNFGRWRSDLNSQIEHCLRSDVRGREIVELLRPEPEDYFVLKPKHSGFFSTTLDTLLQYLQASTLILTGIAGNICILFTANDAYMRDFRLLIPSDCVASNTVEDNEHALALMSKILKADTTPSTGIDLDAVLKFAARHRAAAAQG